ncbi:MAG: hypothetical protein ACRDY4_14500 [Acidimicrobiia bacterium]
MPSMPFYFVAKGAQFELVDKQFDGSRPDEYTDALKRIRSRSSIVELAENHVGGRSDGLTRGDVEHFKKDWLDYWGDYPHNHPVEAVMREGYRKAIELATADPQHPKPIASFWVCANERAYQVYICDDSDQVTVLVFTPPPVEHVSEEQLTEEEPIWVAKARDSYDHGKFESTKRVAGHEIIVKRIMRAPQRQPRKARGPKRG